MMNTIKSSLLYFALVFGAGFLLALIRVPFLVPRWGVRMAELIEMPVMLCVIYFAARWVVRQPHAATTLCARLALGLIALALLLLTEFSVVPWMQGQSIGDALANRDPVSGAAYAASLVVFGVMPACLAPRDTAKT